MIIIAFCVAVFNSVWAGRDALSNLDLIKTWEETSPMQDSIKNLSCFPFSFFFFVCFRGRQQLSSRCVIVVIIAVPLSGTSSSSSSAQPLSAHAPAHHRAASTSEPLFENVEEFWFAATLSLHCHYHSNDYDGTRWLLITQHILLIYNTRLFCASSVCCLIAIHLIKWSSSLDGSIMNLIWIYPYSYCIH